MLCSYRTGSQKNDNIIRRKKKMHSKFENEFHSATVTECRPMADDRNYWRASAIDRRAQFMGRGVCARATRAFPLRSTLQTPLYPDSYLLHFLYHLQRQDG